MSIKGVVDIVFCLDASASMQPCIDAVRRHVVDFVRGLESNPNHKTDWRIDIVAYACDEAGTQFPLRSIRCVNMDLLDAVYRNRGQGLFTTSLPEFQSALDAVRVGGDEATLIGLDTALDFPWRPRASCHRVVVCLTDEPLETNALVDLQQARLSALLDKIESLGVMLYLVAPPSPAFNLLAEVDKSEYEVVDAAGDGLRSVGFGKVLAYMGRSISMASLQAAPEAAVQRGLFGQADWTPGHTAVLSGR